MSRSTEWWGRIGPMRIGIGIRHTDLSEVLASAGSSRELAPALSLPKSAGGIVQDPVLTSPAVLVWESEGGSLDRR